MAAPQGPQVGAYELYRRSSVGVALSDVLDEFISNRQIEPQLALKIISNFDKAVAEALTEKVKNRCNFKVSAGPCVDICFPVFIANIRVISIRIASAMKCGHS